MADSLGFEAEIKCSANKYYGYFRNNLPHLAKHFPEIYKSIEVIEGDGPSVGSVRLWKSELDGHFITTKERTVSVNDESKSITWNVLKGSDLMKLHNSFLIKLVSVTPTREGYCLAKWSVNFESDHGDVSFPTALINLLHKTTVELPARLSKQG
ncbi:hypothetical protein MKW94_019749 [Papaver nudicaule]|uniref:Bet v I/Major latex protein domain-containing protein n=1 Tax=Papaver nudicaule TaxID=74823 RepID=A0AA41SHE1_PAPNU|nr:hypothetical protein [Papaver nudicaule]